MKTVLSSRNVDAVQWAKRLAHLKSTASLLVFAMLLLSGSGGGTAQAADFDTIMVPMNIGPIRGNDPVKSCYADVYYNVTLGGSMVSGSFSDCCGLITGTWSTVVTNEMSIGQDYFGSVELVDPGEICCGQHFYTSVPGNCLDLYMNGEYRGNIFGNLSGGPPFCDEGHRPSAISFSYGFYYNTNTIPLAEWAIKNESGIELEQHPETRHYELPPDGMSQATATLLNGYTTSDVTFSFIGDPLGCTLTPDGVLTAGTNRGTVVVFGELTTNNVCVVKDFYFDLDHCIECAAGKCSAGAPSAYQGSVDIHVSLGASRIRGTAGFLQVKEEFPSPALGTPETLQCNFIRPDLEKITNASGWIVQVKMADGLVNVVTNNSYSYKLDFYAATNVLPKSGGLFRFLNSPDTTVTIENVGGDTNHVRLSDTDSGTIADYYWATNGWELSTGGGLRREIKLTSIAGSQRTENLTIKNGSGIVEREATEIWETFAFGDRLVTRIDGSGSGALTNQYSYHTNGLISQVIRGDGSWEIYQYDEFGRQTNRFHSFLDAAPTTNSALCRVTSSIYSTSVVSGSGDDGSVAPYTPRCVIEYLLGQEISRRYAVLLPGERKEIQCPQPGAAWNDSANLVTTTYYFSDGVRVGNVSKVVRPNGTIELVDIGRGLPSGGSGSLHEKITKYVGAPDGPGTGITQGTKEESYYDSKGRILRRDVTDIPSQLQIEGQNYSYDAAGHLTNTLFLDGTSISQVYNCCELQSRADRDGSVTSYTYDALKRVLTTVRDGITLSNVYNASGDLLATFRFGTNGTSIALTSASYDTAGRQLVLTNALGAITTFTNWVNASNQTVRATTYFDTSTRTEIYARDGSLLSVTGTAAFPMRYAYGAETNGGVYRPYTQEFKLLTNGTDSAEWTKTYRDGAGRSFKTVYPDAAERQSVYNSLGQLSQEIDPDGVVSLFQYDAVGEVEYQAIDVNRNGSIDLSGTDWVTRTVRDVTMQGTNFVRRSQTYVYPTVNSSTPALISISMQAVDTLKSWSIINGVTNFSLTELLGSGQRRVTQTAADGTVSIQASLNGRTTSAVVSNSTSVISQQQMGYDPHGRLLTVTDARNGTSTNSYNNADQITSFVTSSPGPGQSPQTNIMVYDDMGRVWKTQQPDGTWTTNEYYLTGSLKKTSGSRTYPVEYTYDNAGRMQTMKTWQDFVGNSGTAVTTWNYTTNRGFLLNKRYADNQGPAYGYTAAGRLQSRVWARGVTNTYAYDNSGSLQSVTYSDSTPSVAYDYDRLGRARLITGTSTNTLAYDPAGLLQSDDVTAGQFNYASQSRLGYDSINRLTSYTNWTLGVVNQFGYAGSRLSSLSAGAFGVNYAYATNSSLIEGITLANNGTNAMSVARQFDYLNRLQQIASTPTAPGAATISSTYGYNAANQRTASTNADSSYWLYGYDALGQVMSGKKYWNGGAAAAGQHFEYVFDDIGNRTSAKTGGDSGGSNLRTGTYSANLLNQYTNRTVPGYLEANGTAASNATVTVNGLSPLRQGQYYRQELSFNNSSAAVSLAITNRGVDVSSTSIVARATMVPQTPEAYQHDADGNLLQDGLRKYTWDGENRLVRIETLTNVWSSESWQRVDCAYDPQGRRLVKEVRKWNPTSGSYQLASRRKYFYWGWNLMGESDEVTGLRVTYTWGLDLSGTMQGAGGVGGLLKATVHTGSTAGDYYYAYDGNGNVMALVSAADGTEAARYETGPFGELIRSTGPMAKVNPFRFSTKYQDDEDDLYYYGYRAYNPTAGRWLSRDPIEEQGGVNLHGFVGNSGLNSIDAFGLDYGWPVVPPPGSPPTLVPMPPDPLSDEAWQMFTHLMIGDLGAKYELSASTIAAAKSRVDKRLIVDELKKAVVCARSGTSVIQQSDDSFTVETYPGIVNMGNWQLRLTSTANWKCDKATSAVGKCCCECTADIRVKGFMSKTYTFRAIGYNSYNSSWGIGVLNGLAKDGQYYVNWYHDSAGPAYFVSAEFDFDFTQPFKKCGKEQEP